MVEPASLWSLVGLPVLFTLFVWWFSTGAILYLDGLPRSTFGFSLAGATILLGLAFYFLVETSHESGAFAQYSAFTCALVVWGWLEMAFLMGFIVGPRTTACPPLSVGWRRASFAIGAILYHELALLAAGAAIAVLTSGAINQLAFWTFAVLWISRASSKLNLFFGVRNFSEEFLPEHLRYLQTYFTRRPMNLLFPVSVSAGSVAAALLWKKAFDNAADIQSTVGFSFLATLLTLAMLEHWFLVLPINFGALWDWSLGSRRAQTAAILDKVS